MATNKSWEKLGGEIASKITKSFKSSGGQLDYGYDDHHKKAVTSWIPTGCNLLDVAISNIPDGGYPCGKITVLYGPEQSGKSLAAMHAAAETQKLGGGVFYADTEHSFHRGFAEAVGVNTDSQWFMTQENRIEVLFPMMMKWIEAVRETKELKDIPITLVLDSLSHLVLTEDLNNKFGGDRGGYKTGNAIAFSDAFKKFVPVISRHNVCMIVTNQARYKMSVANQYEQIYKQSGGQALPHAASVIVYMTKSGTKKATVNGITRIVGRTTTAKIEKNRLGPPESKIKFDVYFDRGIDNFGSWKDYVQGFKLVKQSGAYFKYEWVDEDTGEVITVNEQGWDNFVKNFLKKYPKAANQLWNEIANRYVMAYQTSSEELEIIDVPDDEDGDVG